MLRKIDFSQMNGVAVTAFVICLVVGALLSDLTHRPSLILVGAVLGLYLLFAIKVVRQWEKVALLRLGRYIGLRGPGIFHIIPVIETFSPFVDQRVRVANVTAESTLTRDTVPV